MPNFNEEFNKYRSKYKGIGIVIPDDILQKIKQFTLEVVKRKLHEDHHQFDNSQEYKRFYTGTLGEVAIEQFLNTKIVNWTIGESSFYHTPDLLVLGINAGIKSVEFGKFPVIFKRVDRSEIITIKLKENTVMILGVALPDVLRKYQDDSLILSPALRSRGTKTGFYGFVETIPFTDINHLTQLIKG